MSSWMVVLMMVGSGAVMAFQAPINAALRGHVGTFESSLISFCVGTLALIVIVALTRDGNLSNVRNVSWWQLLGGLIGALFVTTTLLSAPKIGVTGMIVAALCHSPRDYKETNGPYISEPVKFLLAQVKEDGSVAPPEAAPWIIMALESAQNDKYKPVLEKLQFRTKHPATKTVVFSQASELSAAATKEWLLGAIPKAEILVHDKTKEVSIEGKPVKWGSDVAEALMKLQQKNGSFGDDLQVNALALRLLTLCYKSIK